MKSKWQLCVELFFVVIFISAEQKLCMSLTQHVYHVRDMLRKFIPSHKCQGIVKEACSICTMTGKCHGVLTLFTDTQEWSNVLRSSLLTLAIIYLVKYIWLKGHERTRSMMNIMFTILEKGFFPKL